MKSECNHWQATINNMPGRLAELEVTGDVIVANPGVVASLTRRAIDLDKPNQWLLDLHLVQQPGTWIQVQTCVQVKWSRILVVEEPKPVSIEIRQEDESIALIDSIKKLQ